MKLILGDSLQKLKDLPTATVQCCVTSPPYWGLRDYGVSGQMGLERTPDEYVANMVEVFAQVRRVLKDDGTLWLNLGDSYNAGREGGHAGGKKGISRTTVGPQRCGVNAPNLKPKDLVGIPWRVAFALQADGWYLRQDIIWHKPNPMPESVRDRCTKAHEYMFLLAKSERYLFDVDAIKEPAKYSGPNSPGSIKSPYGQGFTRNASWKGSDFHRGKTAEHQLGRSSKNRSGNKERKQRPGADVLGIGAQAGSIPWEGVTRQKRSVWTVTTKPFKGAHFATFPPDLIEPCILAGSRPGDIVLDPFFGAGTTGLVAQKHGRECIGIELNPEYLALAKERLAQYEAQLPLDGQLPLPLEPA
jgi:DNA modification methylase